MSATATIRLEAAITEGVDAGLRKRLHGITAPVVTFDASLVDRINSLGIRDMTRFLQELAQRHKLRFVECSPVFFEYLSLMAPAAETGYVESFQLEYQCDKCRKVATASVSREAVLKAAAFPSLKCPGCGAVLRSEAELELAQAVCRKASRR
jgi:hypothetical protein